VFEYDPAKSSANKAKHGIDFEEAQALWAGGKRVELSSRNDRAEERFMVIGMIAEKLWTAIVTYRGETVRLISCRRARAREEKLYEQAE